MRRDVCYYFHTDVLTLYQAYLTAAKNPPFARSCKEEYGRSIGFGVNSSLKYNMNGGACTLHFMPYQNGAAVNLRFSIAQLGGARYEKYAEDLTNIVVKALGIPAQRSNINVDEFISTQAPVASAPIPSPAPKPVQAPAGITCSNCHAVIEESNAFCTHCGTAVIRQQFCTRCGAKANKGDRFCGQCGNKLS